MAMLSSDTDCMIAEVMGIFKLKEGSSPCAYFTSGVFRLTLAGMHFVDEYPGISRYSPKVRDGSFM